MKDFRPMRILVVEDEPLVAMMLEDMLDMLGCEVAAVCATVEHAHQSIGEGGFDAVLLDLKLGLQRTDDVAAQLCRANMPFAILSGDTEGADDLGAATIVSKPYTIEQIEAALAMLQYAANL